MVWTQITRAQYRRDQLVYASDTTNAEWLLLSVFLPARCRVGRPREVDLRAVMNAILYILATGCQWRALPKDFPPRSTVQYYFYTWRDQRLWRRINLALVRRARQAMGRDSVPSEGASATW
jgi:putative transposase